MNSVNYDEHEATDTIPHNLDLLFDGGYFLIHVCANVYFWKLSTHTSQRLIKANAKWTACFAKGTPDELAAISRTRRVSFPASKVYSPNVGVICFIVVRFQNQTVKTG